MKIKPLKNRVLVQPKESEEKTKGGIYVPDTAKEKTHEGKVVAVGDSKKIRVRVGDHIIYEKYGGTEIEIDGEKHIILSSKDILAIVEK
ncbi:co-chaperone GroES [Candidatus Woesearchaeota archaeon CG08_land_8_20_14_0_20_47_9]|nr:MAG: co-chaperone GroES [Candidatus Woesearchaeota archaeon CG1_02_47_18]PIN76072.1 MAG: co-chaperone GroES [Candidatus Woesearchaeota archaeon CG10_big_fil_rev_8_21_14_0_10_47_5]PIO03143.1 MAG: co-chaperone GroES [Candidatus Woesearchaeota archaeon CG08_land_8_20_14_0_20_47_9]HII29741.1 co-chaperone GroES [Candidatus Woesearchaeota archaeon]